MNIKIIGSGSNGNAYVLENNNEQILIECGLPYNKLVKEINFGKLCGAIISHSHS